MEELNYTPPHGCSAPHLHSFHHLLEQTATIKVFGMALNSLVTHSLMMARLCCCLRTCRRFKPLFGKMPRGLRDIVLSTLPHHSGNMVKYNINTKKKQAFFSIVLEKGRFGCGRFLHPLAGNSRGGVFRAGIGVSICENMLSFVRSRSG